MKLSRAGLEQILAQAVVELKFPRRRLKKNRPAFRRMLCSNDFELLNSMAGRTALNFQPPTHPPPYGILHYSSYGLVCTWDLFMQDWRMFGADSCDVITIMPTKPPEKFWAYFNVYLAKMGPGDKMAFMDR